MTYGSKVLGEGPLKKIPKAWKGLFFTSCRWILTSRQGTGKLLTFFIVYGSTTGSKVLGECPFKKIPEQVFFSILVDGYWRAAAWPEQPGLPHLHPAGECGQEWPEQDGGPQHTGHPGQGHEEECAQWPHCPLGRVVIIVLSSLEVIEKG